MIKVLQYLYEGGNCSMGYLCEHCGRNTEHILYYNYPCTPEFIEKFCAIYGVKPGLLLSADLTEVKQQKENLAQSHYRLREALR